jgi:hypothetical protein
VLNETVAAGSVDTIPVAAAKDVAATPLAAEAEGHSRLGVGWALARPTKGESPANVILRSNAEGRMEVQLVTELAFGTRRWQTKGALYDT